MPRVPHPTTLRPTGKDESLSRSSVTPVRSGIPLKDVLSKRRSLKQPAMKPSSSPAASVEDEGLSGADDNIKVCVRLRPMNEREQRNSVIPAWTWKDNTIAQAQVSAPTSRNRGSGAMYTYDYLFDPMSATEEIYESAVRRVILATMSGYHGSVFAYGQTSTGKTHTMQGTEEQPGVIPLAIEECFSYISASNDDREFLFRVSYLEIYNEQINDLLCPASTLANVRILENKKLGVQLQGVKEEVVISPQQVYALISAGEAQRHVGSTDANKNSSRSHTIFRMVIESRSRSSKGRSVMSTLSLVDLAGSESVRHANTHGQRQIEGGFINKSLLTLGKVVSMLTEEGDKGGYIPYRDSKLTRLLQPSLGGNAQITIICTATPALLSCDETHNTLKFANRAKAMKNHAAINEVNNEKTLLKKYLQEIAQLKEELARAKATAEEAATLPPSIERLSVGSNGSPSKPSLEALLDASENDEFDEGDDAETQLQNTIAHIERLILTSRKVKKESPGGHIVSNAAITGRHDDTGVGEGLEGMAEEGDSEVAEGRAGSNGGGARGRRPPTIDRTALLSRRQSTSFFDTKPVFSARDASASFSKAWNGTGTIGGGAGEGGGGRFGLATASRGGAGRGTGDEGNNDGTRWAKTTRAAYSRRQTERWGFKGDDDVVVGTPPTVEGSAGSSSGSPPHGRPVPLETRPPRPGASPTRTGRGRAKTSTGLPGGSAASGSDVDLESELEHVHTELRNFLLKKRARKAGGGGAGAHVEDQEVAELRQKLQEVQIGTALSQADSNFLQRELDDREADIAECMDLLEEMERQRKALSDENVVIRTENESYLNEIARLTAILAAREQELHDLKGVSAAEETF